MEDHEVRKKRRLGEIEDLGLEIEDFKSYIQSQISDFRLMSSEWIQGLTGIKSSSIVYYGSIQKIKHIGISTKNTKEENRYKNTYGDANSPNFVFGIPFHRTYANYDCIG